MSPYQAFVFLFVSTTAGLDDCNTVVSIRGYLLIGRPFKIASGKSLTTCILSCDRDANCYSFNYRFPRKTCELNNVTRSLRPEKFIFSPDAVYFDHPSRPAGSCSGNWPCRNKGKCVNLAGAPGFRCQCRYHYVGETCKGIFIHCMNKVMFANKDFIVRPVATVQNDEPMLVQMRE